jgi:dTDP-4-amino-4,6-dideoxygalactose transaminase
MTAIAAVARQHGLLVIEDAAQAHGAERGRKAGTLGDIGCFSFYPGKNLGACGEGGAITTDRADFAETIRSLRDWGQQGKYNHVRHGFNYRMDGIQGAALGVKLPRLNGWNAARRRIANTYQRGLSPAIRRPSDPIDGAHACHVYAIRVADRDMVRADLEKAGIATSIHYPVPVHLQPAYSWLGYHEGDFPLSEALARETLSLPLYPELSEPQVDQIIKSVNLLAAHSLAESA